MTEPLAELRFVWSPEDFSVEEKDAKEPEEPWEVEEKSNKGKNPPVTNRLSALEKANLIANRKEDKQEADLPFVENFNPSQPRDNRGRWSSGGTLSIQSIPLAIKSSSKSILNTLPEEERSAINRWLLSSQSIRSEEQGTILEGVKPAAERFNKVLDKLPKYEGYVFRGQERLSRSQPELKVGDTYKFLASTSASANPKSAASFGTKVGFVIKTKSGVFIPGSNASEVIIRKNVEHKVVGIHKGLKAGSKSFETVYELEED